MLLNNVIIKQARAFYTVKPPRTTYTLIPE